MTTLALDGSLRTVVFKDYRSHWDGVVQKVLASGSAERSVSPGEIAVFTPTGQVEAVEETVELRDGRIKTKTVQAVVYRRTGTRLV